MSIEVMIYLSLALILSSIRRVISGAKNGCFYGKNLNPLPSKLKRSILNLHFLETPAWYTQYGAVFFFCLALLRVLHPEVSLYTIGLSCLISLLFTMGSSSMASWHFQGYINHGSGLPWEDPNENKKSEFAIFGFSFWWPRPWYYKRRKLAVVWGLILIVVGFILLYQL